MRADFSGKFDHWIVDADRRFIFEQLQCLQTKPVLQRLNIVLTETHELLAFLLKRDGFTIPFQHGLPGGFILHMLCKCGFQQA